MHLTDPHLFADPDASLRGTVTHASFLRTLEHVAASEWPADLAAVTGDLIQDDSQQAYDSFCKLMLPLGLPVHCVPGNHDRRDMMQDALRSAGFFYCSSVIMGNWLIVGIDSCVSDQAGGHVGSKEMQRLANALSESAVEHALVCLHHQPLPVGSKWLDQVGLDNGDELVEMLGASGKVRAAIFGHVHQAFEKVRNGVRIVGTPSTCRQFTIASDEFALDGNPAAYRRIELHPDGRFDSELIWVGDA